jgi:hypothetical protein
MSLKIAFLVVVAVLTVQMARAQSRAPEIVSPMNGSHVSNSIVLRWTSQAKADRYEVQLWLESLTLWRDSIVSDTQAVFTGFLPAEYTVSVRGIAGADTSAWSEAEYSFVSDLIGVSETPSASVQVYPNPASSRLNAVGIAEATAGRLYLVDGLGRRVATSDARQEGAAFDVHGLPSGTYFLISEGAAAVLRSVQIEH